MSQGSAVLVVEDDAFTSRMMELQFRKNGFQVTVANSGEEALTHFEKQSFDLVLTDVMMPGISGLDVLSKIRETYKPSQLPVILLTALEDASSILKGLEMGASDFMAKTNEFGIILAKVNHHLEVKRLYEANTEAATRVQRMPEDAPWNWNFAADTMNYSNRFQQILGFNRKELGNSPNSWLDRIHPNDLKQVQDELEAHRSRRKSHFEVNYRIRHKDEGYVWVHSFGVASFSREGGASRMMGSMSLIEPIPNRARMSTWIHQLETLVAGMDGDDVEKRRFVRLLDQLGEELGL